MKLLVLPLLLLGLFSGLQLGNPPAPSSAPVVQNGTLTASTPVTNGNTVGTASAMNSPTSWSITGGNSAGDFAINSSGVISWTASGQTDWAAAVNLKTASLVVQACNNGGATCGSGTVDVNGYADGSVNALGGSAPWTGLFNQGTGGTGTTYVTRPPYKVACVDYACGSNPATAITDPASGGFPACVTSTTSHTITVGGNGPCTIQNYDTSLGNGWQIQITSGCSTGLITIKNNNFKFGTNFGNTAGAVLIQRTGNCPVDMEANTFEGNGCVFANQPSALVSMAGTGAVTAQYNQFLNSAQHGISLQQTGTGNAFTSRFNGYRVFGFGTGTHANPIIFNTSGSFSTNLSNFDVIVQPGASGDPAAVGACPANSTLAGAGSSGNEYFSPNTGSTLTNTDIEYNTLVAVKGGAGFDTFIVRMDAATVTSPVISNNYIDPQGVLTNNTPYLLSHASGQTISGNINMVSGGPCNANGACN